MYGIYDWELSLFYHVFSVDDVWFVIQINADDFDQKYKIEIYTVTASLTNFIYEIRVYRFVDEKAKNCFLSFITFFNLLLRKFDVSAIFTIKLHIKAGNLYNRFQPVDQFQ